jgi:hypothetical protein
MLLAEYKARQSLNIFLDSNYNLWVRPGPIKTAQLQFASFTINNQAYRKSIRAAPNPRYVTRTS